MTSQDFSNLNIKDLSFIDDIKSMAVIGASKKRDYFFLRRHSKNFKGEIYAIHPTATSISGFDDGTEGKIYTSVKDIPNPVDFVFITVPQSKILEVMDDCVEKGVKLASIFTADFSDAGTEEGNQLERDLISHAKGKVRILGPNGMGLYYPKLGITWRDFPVIPGKIGFIAQSGGLCNLAIYMAKFKGLYFSKVFSIGNAVDIDFIDVLAYLSQDPETDIILCYLEGIKKGRGKELQQILAKNEKPIIIIKGGQTNTGAAAVKTHTASISGENRIWRGLFNQYNAIEVSSLEELINTAKLIKYCGAFKFDSTAILSMSGGFAVVLVDVLEKVGISVPRFSPEIQKKIDSKFFIHGTSSKNPLDAAAQGYHTESIYEIIDLALSDEKIDGLIMDMPPYYFSVSTHLQKNEAFEEDTIRSLNLGHKHKKPLIFILHDVGYQEHRDRVTKKLNELKIPVFGEVSEFISILPKISNYASKIRNR